MQAAIAKAFVGAFVSAGICVVVDRMISSTGVIVRATRYELTYYGEDKQTSKKSFNYKGDRRYKVTSSGFHLNEEYTEGLLYSASKPRNRIAGFLTQNLCGMGFHVYDKR